MTSEQWERLKDLLAAAIERPAGERTPAYIRQVCDGDAALIEELEQLLLAHEAAAAMDFDAHALSALALADRPNGHHALRADEAEAGIGTPADLGVDADSQHVDEARLRLTPGTRVGAYVILDDIAVGGMGAVYRAVRADGEYTQQVALKILRADLGALSAERFRAERQILATLDHPNIARILDGGTTADGLPYLVMELIEGLPITEYCDQHRLSIAERLRLFRVACAAVHYAHQHLIVHRDIKPSNLLVTGDAVPKLLDFGVAKILDPAMPSAHRNLTVGGLWMMTPEYASPEQFLGEPITTATDVYSLGLVLYELVSGHHAFRFRSRLPHEIAQTVIHTDPERPSTAIRRTDAGKNEPERVPLTPDRVSELRGDSPERLYRRLAGDLDNIVLKALRKEPRDRYGSADQLADDLERYLAGLPVTARRSTVAYRCRKYVLRHKTGVGATVLVFLALVTSLAVTVREARLARTNQLRAERRFNDVRRLANSLMFEVHDAIQALPGATAPRKLIVQRAQEYLDSLAADANADVSLLRELAAAYMRLGRVQGDAREANLGNSEQMVRNYRRAADLRERIVAARPSDPASRRDLADSYLAVVSALRQTRGSNDTQELRRKALSLLEPLAAASPGDHELQYMLGKAVEAQGMSLASAGRWTDATASYERSLAIFQSLATAAPEVAKYRADVAFAHKHIGSTLTNDGRLQSALEHYRAALSIDESRLETESTDSNAAYAITFSYADIGYILGKQGDLDGALESYRKALDIRRDMAAADPRDTRARGGLARIYGTTAELRRKKGDWTGALDDQRRALDLREALSRADATNAVKQLQVVFSRAAIGETYVMMAFQPRVQPPRRIALCGQAVSWLKPALPEIVRGSGNAVNAGYLPEYRSMLQDAYERCRTLPSAPPGS